MPVLYYPCFEVVRLTWYTFGSVENDADGVEDATANHTSVYQISSDGIDLKESKI